MNNNFADLPKRYSQLNNSHIVIIPVPYDATSTWNKGADRGPDAIINASAHMELYDIETDSEIFKWGIYTDDPLPVDCPPVKMVEIVAEKIKFYLKQKKFIVTLGGEHSISIGAARAHADFFNGEISVLQLDAHSDLRNSYENSPFNHACTMARIKEKAPIVQVGIRSMDISEKNNQNPDDIFFAEKIINQPNWIDQVVSRLNQQVYLTIDLDVFDPSIMPATGTPEPGGLGWYEVLELLKTVIRQRKLVGFDMTELCPHQNNPAPDFLAAKLLYKILSYQFINKGK